MAPYSSCSGLFRRETLRQVDSISDLCFLGNASVANEAQAVDVFQARFSYLTDVSIKIRTETDEETRGILINQCLFVCWQLNKSTEAFEWFQDTSNNFHTAFSAIKSCVANMMELFISPNFVFANSEDFRIFENFLNFLINSTDLSSKIRDELVKSEVVEHLMLGLTTCLDFPIARCRLNSTMTAYLGVLFNLTKSSSSKSIFESDEAQSTLKNVLLSTKRFSKQVSIVICLILTNLGDSSWLTDDLLSILIDCFNNSWLEKSRSHFGISISELGCCFRQLSAVDKNADCLLRNQIIDVIELLLNSVFDHERNLGVELAWTLQSSSETAALELFNRKASVMEALAILASTADCPKVLRDRSQCLVDLLKQHGTVQVDTIERPRASRSRSVPLIHAEPASFLFTKPPKIYLSFHKADNEFAAELDRILGENQFLVLNILPATDSTNDKDLRKQLMLKADLVAICHSPAYSMSPSCKQEAEFASSTLHKKIVSVQLDAEYEPDSWLEQILEYSALAHIQAQELLRIKSTDPQTVSRIVRQMASLI